MVGLNEPLEDLMRSAIEQVWFDRVLENAQIGSNNYNFVKGLLDNHGSGTRTEHSQEINKVFVSQKIKSQKILKKVKEYQERLDAFFQDITLIYNKKLSNMDEIKSLVYESHDYYRSILALASSEHAHVRNMLRKHLSNNYSRLVRKGLLGFAD